MAVAHRSRSRGALLAVAAVLVLSGAGVGAAAAPGSAGPAPAPVVSAPRPDAAAAPGPAAPPTTAAAPEPPAAAGAPPGSRAPAAAARPAPPGHLVVLGDSVPAGNGCGCRPYPALLGQALSTSAAPVGVTNVGTGGLTTAGLLAQLDDPGLQQSLRSATVVVVTIGANDFDDELAGQRRCAAAGSDCFAGPAAALPGLLGRALDRVRDLAPGARVLVTGYWNVFLDGEVGRGQGSDYVQTSDALTRQVDALVQAAAVAAGATYVDVYDAFESRSLADLTALLAPDGDHPSAAGHALLAQLLLAAVRAGG